MQQILSTLHLYFYREQMESQERRERMVKLVSL